MTIKQNGGVFGRNPTFNDVTIEGQLTFDGDIDINSDLKVDGDLVVTGGMTVDTSTLVVDDANNRVGIGTDTPQDLLHITLPAGVNGDIVALGRAANSYQFHLGMTAASMFYIADNSSNIKVGFPYTGGITFNGDTATSNALDDYEQGNWTPAFTGSDSGTSTQTVNAATYTKIGRAVHITCYLAAVDVSSLLGASMNLTGLPFTCSSFQHFTAGYSSLFTFDQADIGVSGYTTNGSTSCRLLKGSSTTSISATAEATTTSGVIMITFTYQTDA